MTQGRLHRSMVRQFAFLLACLFSAIASGVAQRPDATFNRPPERHKLDLDGDGVVDELVVSATAGPNASGAYNRLDLKLSRSGAHSLSGSWDRLRPHDTSVKGNAVNSRLVFVGKLRRGGALIILFGEDLGCCAQGIDVYRVGPAGVERYFSRPEFSAVKPLNLRSAVPLLVGQESPSETAGTSAPDARVASEYNPVLVYRFEARPRLDSAASVRVTRSVLGGFAGLERRSDVMAVLRSDNTRYLWDEKNKRGIP